MKIVQFPKTKLDPYKSIPLEHPILGRVREIIPAQWWGSTWVAGSAATRFGQHQDVDVWITSIPRNINPSVIIPGPLHIPVEQANEDYEHIAIKIYNNLEEKLQIMACHDDIRTLLNSFDISVHCGATHILTGEQIRGENYSELVTICNYLEAAPVLTLTRYLTMAKRYKDFTGMFNAKVQQCAADTFYLKTPAHVEQMLRDNYIDVGL